MPVSLLSLLIELPRTIDDGSFYAVTSATSTTVVSNALKNATTNASITTYNGAFAYANAQQRLVRTDGLAPSTGTLTIRPDWASTPTSAHTLILTTLFPCTEDVSGGSSYRTLINRAAALLAYGDRVAVAIGTGYSYPLTTYPWLDREARLIRVLEPGPTGGQYVDASWRGPKLVLDGPTPALELTVPFGTATGSLILEVLRPAHTLVETAGVWAENTAGLSGDTDRLRIDVADILPAFKLVVYEALVGRSPGRPYPGAKDQAEYWRGQAMASRLFDWTQAGEQRAVPNPAGAAA